MGEWRRAAAEDEVPEGRGLRVELDGRVIGLFRWEGRVYAIDDTCTHEEASLSDGWVEDGCAVCPRHGARFDLASGRAVTLPAVLPVRTYPVRVEDGAVWVRLVGA